MKKTFCCCLIAAVLFLMMPLSVSALAQETGCPVNSPDLIDQFPTQWQLFAGDPVDFQVTLQVEEETGLRTYTIHNPAYWGLDASVCGVWQYAEPNADAVGDETGASASGWVQTSAEGGQVQLVLGSSSYEQSGFPRWTASCSGPADSLTLNVYLGQVRHLYAYVDYQFGENTVSVYAQDSSFTVSCMQTEEKTVVSTYASYDPYGVLAYASYSVASADGSLTTYRVEAIPHLQTYTLTEVSHTTSEGQFLFFADDQWQNENYEPAEAPEGISTEELPFAITGQWVGIPFEEPGDKPEGLFPAGHLPADPALAAADVLLWPQTADALYLRWTDAGQTPALPSASWITGEDGSVAYVLTGLGPWGVQESHMGDWNWNASSGEWERGEESTPGQMTLIVPAGEPVHNLSWEMPTCHPGETLTLYLSRTSMLEEVQLTAADGSYWQMDNQGGFSFMRPLDDHRWLTAAYGQYMLLDYSVHTLDDASNPVCEACYSPAEGTEDAFELACFFVYSTDTRYEEYLWIRNIGWYSYETGEPCSCPDGVVLEDYPPLTLL